MHAVVCLAVLVCVALYFARVTVYGVSCRPGLYAAKFARKFAAVALKVGMDIERAERALLAVDDAMRETRVPYWLSEGTALGVFRAGALICGDDDVDFVVARRHREALLRRTVPFLRTLGFEVIWIRNGGDFLEMYHTALGIMVDIDVVSEDRKCVTLQGAKHGAFVPCTGIGEVEETLVTRRYLGREFRLPSLPYYERVYGPGWRVPT